MRQINPEELSDDLSSLTHVANDQDEESLNDTICLSIANNESSCQQKATADADTIRNNLLDCSNEDEVVVLKRTPAKPSKRESRRYLPAWEKESEAFYRTHASDSSRKLHVKLVCWLYKTNDENGRERLRCKLCEKYQKTINTNGKANLWCTSGYETIKLSKIKEHHQNEVHTDAQQIELETTAGCQPSWSETQVKERNKHETAIENLILSAVHICQQDQSLNSFERLCVLLEAVGVKLLPAEIGGISYRNDNAALEFLHHVAFRLHEEVVEKIKKSPSIGMKKLTT